MVFAGQGALLDNPAAYRLRSGEVILPRSADWWDGSRHLREKSLAEPPELKLRVTTGR